MAHTPFAGLRFYYNIVKWIAQCHSAARKKEGAKTRKKEEK